MIRRGIRLFGLMLFLGAGNAHAHEALVGLSVGGVSSVQPSDVLLYAKQIRILRGSSTWTDYLSFVAYGNPLKLRAVVEPSCVALSAQLHLRSAADLSWHQARTSGELSFHNANGFDAVHLELYNPNNFDLLCDIRIFSTAALPPPRVPPVPPSPDPVLPDWGPGSFAGGADYQGGYASQLEVAVSAADRIKGFRIAIPEFCRDVSVLQAGVITEGVYEPAQVLDERNGVFGVQGGSVRTSRVVFSLNGPSNSTCFIPLYLY